MNFEELIVAVSTAIETCKCIDSYEAKNAQRAYENVMNWLTLTKASNSITDFEKKLAISDIPTCKIDINETERDVFNALLKFKELLLKSGAKNEWVKNIHYVNTKY